MKEYMLALSDAELARYQFMAQLAVLDEADQWAAAGVVEGAEVADVGCGPGALSAVLARIVGPSGTVHAVDRDAQVLALARALASEAGLANIVFSEGTATATGLAPTEISERYLRLHSGLGNDLAVGLRLGELLVRAGLEQDDHRGRYIIVRPQAGMRQPPWAAREQMLAAGVIDNDDIARWQAEFDRIDRGERTLTMIIPNVTASARRPT